MDTGEGPCEGQLLPVSSAGIFTFLSSFPGTSRAGGTPLLVRVQFFCWNIHLPADAPYLTNLLISWTREKAPAKKNLKLNVNLVLRPRGSDRTLPGRSKTLDTGWTRLAEPPTPRWSWRRSGRIKSRSCARAWRTPTSSMSPSLLISRRSKATPSERWMR